MIQLCTKKSYSFLSPNIRLCTEEEVVAYLISERVVYGLDIETSGLEYRKHKMLLLQIGDKLNQYVIDVASMSDYLRAAIADFMRDTNRQKILHYASFDAKFIRWEFNCIVENIYDSLVVETILTAGKDLKKSLADLHFRYLGIYLDKQQQMEYVNNPDKYLSLDSVVYAAKDVENLEELKNHQLVKYYNEGNTKLLLDLELDIIPVLIDIEFTGIHLNKAKYVKDVIGYLEITSKKLDKVLKEIIINLSDREDYKKLRKFITGGVQIDIFGNESYHMTKSKDKKHYETSINFNSSDQVGEVLKIFNFELPKTKPKVNKKTGKIGKAKDSTGKDALLEIASIVAQGFVRAKDIVSLCDVLVEYKSNEYYSDKLEQLFVDTLMANRTVSKLLSSYGYNFIDNCDENSRLHTNFSIVVTGRLASDKVNLQNIPKNKLFRNCFEAPEGWLLVVADYSAAELVVIANNSGDEDLIKAFRNKEDIHCMIASKAFRRTITKEDDPEAREQSKTVTYGLAYGAGAKKFAKVLGGFEKAKVFINDYNAAMPKVHGYLVGLENFALARGYSVTNAPYFRRRYYPKWQGKKTPFKDEASIKREAKNQPIQGTQADIIKLAMVQLYKRIQREGLQDKIIMVLQVHDEIILQVRPEVADYAKEILEHQMKRASEMILKTLPIEAEAKISNRWAK